MDACVSVHNGGVNRNGRIRRAYLPPRRLHAHAQGVGLEIMARSGNVLRGGLMPRRVNVDELVRVLASRLETTWASRVGPASRWMGSRGTAAVSSSPGHLG